MRSQFADWMVSPKNPRFAAAIANRLWKRIFGIAVQVPVVDLDEKSSATNPELLAFLTGTMKNVNFDLRAFQRILLNTKTYQRQSSPDPDGNMEYRFPGPVLRRMTAEQMWDSAVILARGTKVESVQTDHAPKMRRLLIPGNIPMDRKKMVKHKDEIFAFARTLKAKKPTDKNPSARSIRKGKSTGGRGLFLSIGKRRGDDGWIRASELSQPMPPGHFLRIAGQSARDVADDGSTEGGIGEALAFMNGEVAERTINPKSYAMTLVNKSGSNEKKIQILYQSFLSRMPTTKEEQRIKAAMNSGMSTSDVAWSLLNSREFIFIQ
jgi:hypothetical protein